MNIFPIETTTYTLTATGPGGSTVQSVTVTVVQLPTVTISASPDTIAEGQSSTLTWVATNADTCAIEPEVGAVGIEGSVDVSPASTTVYTITATGPGGTAAAQATVNVALPPITVQITSPQSGEMITRPDVLVTGTFTNSAGLETGITVNGAVAMVQGNEFAAGQVPLEAGENTLTVSAVDTAGNTAEASVTISAEMSGQYISISAAPQSGVAPFETALTVSSPVTLLNTAVTVDGPQGATVIENGTTSFTIDLTAAGLYSISVQALDENNAVYTDTAIVQVWDRQALDAMLQAKWEGMKAGLATGDIQAALNYFSSANRDEYEAIFTALGDQLPQISQQMQGIEMIYSEGGFAKYRINRDEIHQGQTYSITYDIYFDCADSGLWKIARF